MNTSNFIVVEWIDTTWKTTLSQSLSEKFWATYYKTPWQVKPEERKQLDEPWVSVQERFDFYLNACKKDYVRIQEILENWTDVICDRFIDSTVACHNAMVGVDTSEGEKLSIESPRIQILLSATIETVIERLKQRSEITRFEADTDFMQRAAVEFKKCNNNLEINTTLNWAEKTTDIAHKFITNN